MSKNYLEKRKNGNGKTAKSQKSFSKSKKGFPYGSFIDENYLNSYKKKYFLLLIKNIAKFTLGRIKFLEISPNFKY